MPRAIETIELQDLATVFQGRLGLILGPSTTIYQGVLSDLATHLATKFSIKEAGNYTGISERILDQAPDKEAHLRQSVKDFFANQKPSPILSHLAQVRWRAILSATLDPFFEEKFVAELERKLFKESVGVLVDPSTPPPPRSIPVYKLIGSIQRDGFVTTDANYLRRRPSWRIALRTFADHIQNAPVFCSGMADCPWILHDLLAEMMASAGAPSTLFFLADDPTATDPKLLQLLDPRTRVFKVPGTIGTVAQAISALAVKKITPASNTAKPAQPKGLPKEYSDLVAIVGEHTRTSISLKERQRLHDLLFSPSVARWDPLVHGLDFQRTLGPELYRTISTLIGHGSKDSACILSGRSGSGKTMLLKRVALDLAKAGHLVLWFKTSFYQDTPKQIAQFFKDLAATYSGVTPPVIIFLDDPLSMGSLFPRDIISSCQANGFRPFFVVGVRSSDWASKDKSDFIGSLSIAAVRDLADKLDPGELTRLPEYLVLLGACSSKQEAQTRVSDLNSTNSSDALSMLYWLLPETRSSIASSIQDEYFRLSDRASLSKILIGAIAGTSTLLKKAYEMVAVSDYYRTPLPIEVLVSALEVNYQEWLDAVFPTGPAWGLLYAEDSEDGLTICYRTRNNIVTKTLIEALNGGTLGHSGEVRVLSSLLGACTGTQATYREFCLKVLVSNESFEKLDFEDGLRLYERATESLPHPDKTLVHQKGLWIKRRGNDPDLATRIFKQALDTPNYPFANRSEADEHIHTSIAASLLDAIDAGKVDLAIGKDEILKHLARARSARFMNPSAVHVEANLTVRLADRLGESQIADIHHLVSRAMATVDQTLLILRPSKATGQHADDDVRMLESVRDKLSLKYQNESELRKQADHLWNQYQSQHGFVLLGRRLFHLARKEDKGRAFKDALDYTREAMSRVESAAVAIAPELHQLAADILYRWRIQSHSGRRPSEAIEWALLHDYAANASRAAHNTQEPFYKYLQALALSQLGRWPDATVLFTQLRQLGMPPELLWERRDWILGESNLPRRVQGTIKRGASRTFLHVEELGNDFHIRRVDEWPREGEIAHAYIGISFAGLTALQNLS